MNENNFAGIALEEAYRWFEILNKKYYQNKLDYPVITIQKSPRGKTMGWFTIDRVWTPKEEQNKDEKSKYEICLCGEFLNDDIHEVIGILHHEMVHYANKVNNIKDCNNQIHNKQFKNLAESVNLIVEKSKKYGFGHTTCSPELIKFIDETIKPSESCFEYFRNVPKKESKETKKTQFTYQCPECKEKIKAKADKIIICGNCSDIDSDNIIEFEIQE